MSLLTVYFVLSACALAALVFVLFFYRSWRRAQVLANDFPKAWRKHLRHGVPLYRKLPKTLQRDLEQRVQLFIAEKTFYGCDGFNLTERVKITVAGHACLLIVARPFAHFDGVRSILIYPDLYQVEDQVREGDVIHPEHSIRAGEACSQGRVVLAWSACQQAIKHPKRGHNVILHEFAHQLDFRDGLADGAPPLQGEEALQWQRVMSRAYADLNQRLKHHKKPWLDPYGASEPAEFFAVLTEAFFQQPKSLHKHQPEVYSALANFYRLDPLSLTQ